VSDLYLVATPIGNLEDVSLRALKVLEAAELVLAEDTRRTRVLLDRHNIPAKPVSLHAHNEAGRVSQVLAVLDGGGDVALVSDAGTPLISDPGDRLVDAALEAGHSVVPIPGASALLAALAASGLPAVPFTFVGFLPRRSGECDRALESLRDRRDTLIFFESPRRIAKTLERLKEAFGERQACVARELTKMHEEFARGSLSELAERFAEGARGECTLVVEGASATAAVLTEDELDAAIRARVATGQSPREISDQLAQSSGLPKREIYARVVALKSQSENGDGERGRC
jgi:16S rRNA (cytidine1402-2'-O)-methyltransferase